MAKFKQGDLIVHKVSGEKAAVFDVTDCKYGLSFSSQYSDYFEFFKIDFSYNLSVKQ